MTQLNEIDMTQEMESLMQTSRFSRRAANYHQFRPAYHPQIRHFLEHHFGLRPSARIADIGSGTGRFARLWLEKGYSVTAVEPDEQMRVVAEKNLEEYAHFSMVDGTAENTGLRNRCMDLVTVANAFHWMDPYVAGPEFNRILRPNGHIVLLWTLPQSHTDFQTAYEQLKRDHRVHEMPVLIDEGNIQALFADRQIHSKSFRNIQWLNFDGLKGLLLSSLGIPLPGHPYYEVMISGLIHLFVTHNRNGFVQMEQETRLFWAE